MSSNRPPNTPPTAPPRLPTPPRPARAARAGVLNQPVARTPPPEEADAQHRIALDENTDERKVTRSGQGATNRSESIPVPTDEALDEALDDGRLPRVSRRGHRTASLSELLEQSEVGLEEARRGIGPAIVVLHDGITGIGTRGLGALKKGRVVKLSRLLGRKLTETFVKDPSDNDALRALRHYMNPDDPAIREATDEEAQFDEVEFVEGEKEALQALEDSTARVEEVNRQNQQLKELVRQMGLDPEGNINELMAQVRGANEESRLPPSAPNPKGTGESDDPGDRNPGFTQQQPQRRTAVEQGQPSAPGAPVQESGEAGGEDDFADEFNTPDTANSLIPPDSIPDTPGQ